MGFARDSRWTELARILVEHSTSVGPGNRVLIIMREVDTFPLAREVYAECIRRGAHPQTLFTSVHFERDKMSLGTDAQSAWTPELFETGMKWAEVCIDLRGATNLYEFSGLDAHRISLHRKGEGTISALRTAGTRWVLVRVPNETIAQQARTNTDAAMDVFFSACLHDWRAESVRLERMASSLNGSKSIRIATENTDLVFSTEGRAFVAEDGRINMPGGEIYTSPVEESVEGTIVFDQPGVFAGLLMENIRMTFERGRVVEAHATTNDDFLQQILATDEGSRSVGEFGIGTNRGLTFFSNDILYDEKIYGTVHIALGRSYAECGGRNSSALHWDIIKDLRAGGTLFVDDQPLIQGGRLLFDPE